jgi:hypothetical protein
LKVRTLRNRVAEGVALRIVKPMLMRNLFIKACANAYRHPARRPHAFFHTESLLNGLLFAAVGKK